jgi:toxin ParE1/3/4
LAHVNRTSQAEIDLLEIWLFIADDSIEAADRLLAMIDEKCRLLADRPQLGRARPDLAVGLRSFPADNYILYYKPEPDGIFLARVLHGSRDQEAAFGY